MTNSPFIEDEIVDMAALLDSGGALQVGGDEHRRLCRHKYDPLGRDAPPHTNSRDPGRRLRIGYVSPDFWMHPVARFMLPLLEHQSLLSSPLFIRCSLAHLLDPL